jgi:hypothetical protein
VVVVGVGVVEVLAVGVLVLGDVVVWLVVDQPGGAGALPTTIVPVMNGCMSQ